VAHKNYYSAPVQTLKKIVVDRLLSKLKIATREQDEGKKVAIMLMIMIMMVFLVGRHVLVFKKKEG